MRSSSATALTTRADQRHGLDGVHHRDQCVGADHLAQPHLRQGRRNRGQGTVGCCGGYGVRLHAVVVRRARSRLGGSQRGNRCRRRRRRGARRRASPPAGCRGRSVVNGSASGTGPIVSVVSCGGHDVRRRTSWGTARRWTSGSVTPAATARPSWAISCSTSSTNSPGAPSTASGLPGRTSWPGATSDLISTPGSETSMLNNDEAVSTVAMLWAPPKSADSSTNHAVSVAAVASSATSGMRNTRATASPQGLSHGAPVRLPPQRGPGPSSTLATYPTRAPRDTHHRGIDSTCRDHLRSQPSLA